MRQPKAKNHRAMVEKAVARIIIAMYAKAVMQPKRSFPKARVTAVATAAAVQKAKSRAAVAPDFMAAAQDRKARSVAMVAAVV